MTQQIDTVKTSPSTNRPNAARCLATLTLLALALFALGCASTKTPGPSTASDPVPYGEIRLREGDAIKITFPGSPNLDSTPQQIRRDGKITIALGGEVVAAGKTPAELEKDILKTYGGQLAVQQVVVTVNSSSYPVFVTGAVLRPGKITPERPLTVLEAIMEAGGPDFAKANLKKVSVVRQFEGQSVSYIVDIDAALKGTSNKPFYLKPSDVIYVPEKYRWF